MSTQTLDCPKPEGLWCLKLHLMPTNITTVHELITQPVAPSLTQPLKPLPRKELWEVQVFGTWAAPAQSPWMAPTINVALFFITTSISKGFTLQSSCCSVANSFPTLRLHGLWHPRLPCLSLSPFLLLPSIFPASRSFLVSWLFISGGQSIGTSASVLPMNIQSWFPLGLSGLISLLSKGLSRVFSSTTNQEYQFFGTQSSLWSNSHIHIWLLEKPKLWLYGPLSAKWHICFLISCLGLS